jgi:hypothetical protein
MRVPMVPVAVLLAVGTAACGHPESTGRPTVATTSTTTAVATAAPVPPDPEVGAVFLGGADLHTCSASVLASADGDLILTAAHCFAGGIDATFVAGFNNEAAPEDVWHLDAVYLDPRWVTNQDPLADFAIARVSREAGGSVQAQAGGGLVLGVAPPAPGTAVTVTGYGTGVGGGPIGCRAPTAVGAGGYPSLPCAGLVNGFSGAPWTTGSTVTGLVGGLDGGGCDDDISYSPPFDDQVTRLLVRAEAGGPGDQPPTAFEDDC